ncbi:MAG: tetratricopeptide repeat protein [Planctomycetales bacterium]|nr:tetratricopeptide repeat protein [Planctomycetales bacterium]
MRRIVILVLLALSTGCQTLRSRRQTAALTTARQLSLHGASELEQERYTEAEEYFAEALQNSAADERAYWGMAQVLWEQGDRAKAIQHMARAAAISGDRPDLLVQLGEMYFSEGAYEQAIAQADAAIAGQRDLSSAWALRGKVLQERGDLEDALSSYHRALHLKEYYPEVQVAIAQIYQDMEQPQRALHTLDCMLDSRTEDAIPPFAWLLKGQALADLGESTEAKLCLREAAQCAQDSDVALLLKVAESQIEFGDLAEARICVGRAIRQNPYDPQALRIRAHLDATFENGSPPTMLTGHVLR